MNILQVETATNVSGGAKQTILNSIGLKKRGYRIFIACVRGSFVYNVLSNEGFEIIEISEDKTFYSANIVRSFLKKMNMDIVHTHHPRGHTIGVLASMFRNKEALCVQRSVIFPPTNIFKFLNPRVDAFIVNSKAVKNILIRHFIKPSKIYVVYSAVEKKLEKIDRFSIRKELGINDGFLFGTVGNYSRYKGHDLAIKAFTTLDNGSYILLIGKDTEKLGDLLNSELHNKVKILGFRKDASKLIQCLDCLVIPSLKESFPNVAIEAFFSRVGVIGTNIGGIPELLQNRGIICKPEILSIANAMRKAMNFPQSYINEAYNFANAHLTPERKIDKLETIYVNIINRKRQ